MKSLVKHTVQTERTGEIAAREIANIAYGAALISERQLTSVLFMALARAASHEGEFNSQDLASTAWAFATVGHNEEGMFTALAAAAERRILELKQ